MREGAVSAEDVAAAMEGQFHFIPGSYLEMIRSDIPVYDRFQDELVAASRGGAGGCWSWGRARGRRPPGCSSAIRPRSWSA